VTGRHALLEVNDRYHLLKYQTFMLEFARLRAQFEQKSAEKEAPPATKGSKATKVPFKFDTSHIGVSLQFTSLNFCLDLLDTRVRNPSQNKGGLERPPTDKEFHAGLLYLT
jgi:hypothetical protein